MPTQDIVDTDVMLQIVIIQNSLSVHNCLVQFKKLFCEFSCVVTSNFIQFYLLVKTHIHTYTPARTYKQTKTGTCYMQSHARTNNRYILIHFQLLH